MAVFQDPSKNPFVGPEAVDLQVRQAIVICWTILPESERTVEKLEAEIRRIVDRALIDLKEDCEAFGITEESD